MPRLCRVVLLALLCVALNACADGSYRMRHLKLRFATADERRASLAVLERAWEERPARRTEEGCLYERALLNRAAHFGRQVRGTESYRAACDLWKHCAHEHIARYGRDRNPAVE